MTSRVSIPLTVCVLAAIVAGIMLARPGSSPPTPAAAATEPAAAAEPTIRIEAFAFDQNVTVEPGQVVQVVNADGAPHTLTSVDGGFGTGTLDPGAASSFAAPSEPGVYAFFCEIHPSMTGTFTVEG